MKRNLQIAGFFLVIALLSSCGRKNTIETIGLIPVQTGNEYQYIDRKGKIVINPQFSNATCFYEGLALVRTSDDSPKWGFINKDGKYEIMANFKEASVFQEGLAWVVQENAAPTAIDKKGEIVITLQDAEQVRVFSEGLAAFSVIDDDGNEKWGFVNKNGAVTINPQFTSAGDFNEGLCAVSNNERKYGYINKQGLIVINYQFDEANKFINGKAVVRSSDRYGAINKKGNYIINPQFSEMIPDNKNFMIQQGGRWGWCDDKGKIIINPQFSSASPFLGNKLASVNSGNNWGFIDRKGRILVNPQFSHASPFNGNLSLVTSAQKIGFINQKGNYVINPQFDGTARDYRNYIVSGESAFQRVRTDYFNIDLITSVINIESPEGLSFNLTFGELMEELNLRESSFNKSGVSHRVIPTKRISNDARYNLVAVGLPFEQRRYQVGSGWNSRWQTDYIFNREEVVSLYAYEFELTGKGRGKATDVVSAIENTLSSSSFTKTDDNTFVNDNYTVRVSYKDSSSPIVSIQYFGSEYQE